MFCVYEGDHLTLLNVYNAFIRVRGSMGLYVFVPRPFSLLGEGGGGAGDKASVSTVFVPSPLPLLREGGGGGGGGAGDEASVSTVFVPRPLSLLGGGGLGTRLGSLLSLFQGPSLSLGGGWGRG